ncbi:MAG: hypothetical protein KF780_03900 [Sphingomonas sp.]|nr:hypothetical protein [Sphingomonas sp.]
MLKITANIAEKLFGCVAIGIRNLLEAQGARDALPVQPPLNIQTGCYRLEQLSRLFAAG